MELKALAMAVETGGAPILCLVIFIWLKMKNKAWTKQEEDFDARLEKLESEMEVKLEKMEEKQLTTNDIKVLMLVNSNELKNDLKIGLERIYDKLDNHVTEKQCEDNRQHMCQG